MNIFSVIDQFIFGPTLDFATTTRYSVGDAVSRIRSVTMPRWMWRPRFQRGLYGNVDPDRVVVGWHNPWMRDGFQPWFVGRFVQDVAGTHLVGTIGFPAWQRAFCYLWIAFWFVIWIVVSQTTAVGSTALWFWPFGLGGVILVVALWLNAWMRRNDAQSIADALDASLA